MTAAIAHRGPDDSGQWSDAEAGIALGHRRLSVIDLSPHGHQPMVSADGRWVLNYNGEIYNHAAMRGALEAEGAVPEGGWRGHSDTETFLQAIAEWGLDRALADAVGMFAFALWDRRERSLSLVRDRFGEKPLYYGWAGGDFVFASELKAIRAHPRFVGEVDRRALYDYAMRTHVPAPRSIYRGIFKLPPGSMLSLTAEAATARRTEPIVEGLAEGGLQLHCYWDYRRVVEAGLAEPIDDEAQALAALEAALSEAVQVQSFADVPVGAFLSGGIDSSAIVSLACRNSSRTVRTYSIGFDQEDYDEARHAKAVAAHFGTIHHEHYVSPTAVREVIPLLPRIYDEPFADSSQIPTYLVSRFARGEVTVALTGDGGDELFGGYNRHTLAPAMWRRASRLPLPLRRAAAGAATLIPGALLNKGGPHFAAKIRRGAELLGSARSFDDLYAGLRCAWRESPVIGEDRAGEGFDLGIGGPDSVRAMYADAVSYLPDDILCKVDRASMSCSLETRVPFLDHRVAALAARIPLALKVRDGQGKYLLRKLLFRHAPRALFARPKAGFSVPVGAWIRGPLRPWAEDLLDARRISEEGWFDAAIVQRHWQAHLTGRRDSTPAIWGILMFQSWLRQQSEVQRGAG